MNTAAKPSSEPVQKISHTEDAERYMKQKKVYKIINELATAVLYNKPENPKEFMIKRLEEMRAYKLKGMGMPQYTRENLTALFRMFDVTGKGVIPFAKYTEGKNKNAGIMAAMKDIGISNYNNRPKGFAEDKITCDTFVEEATMAMTSDKY